MAALTNLGQAGAYYDANGHYVRTQPALFAFTLNNANLRAMPVPIPALSTGSTRSATAARGSAVRRPRPTVPRRPAGPRMRARARCRPDHESAIAKM